MLSETAVIKINAVKKNPVAQNGTKGKGNPFFRGIRFVLVALCRDVYRIPVLFRIILPKNHPEYKLKNDTFPSE